MLHTWQAFTVIPDHPPSPLVPFITSLLATVVILMVIAELGMMPDLVWGVALSGMGFYMLLQEANRRVDLMIEWFDSKWEPRRPGEPSAEQQLIPIRAERPDEDQHE